MDAENDSWKKNLSLIHRRQHSPCKVTSHGKENSKNAAIDYIDRDYDQESLAFIDPAISIFDSSTPKYKIRSIESPSTSESKRTSESLKSTKWDAPKSMSRQDKIQKIIDFRSDQDNEDQQDHVNMQTPTRNKKAAASPQREQKTPDRPNKETRDAVIRTLDFSILDTVEDDVAPTTARRVDGPVSANPSTPNNTELSGPKADVSPETEVLKQSTLQGDLKSKIPSAVRRDDTPGFTTRPAISPTQSKLDSDFAHHLVGTIPTGGPETDVSFIDALSDPPTTTSNIETPKRHIPKRESPRVAISAPKSPGGSSTPCVDEKTAPGSGNPHVKPAMVAPSPAPSGAHIPFSSHKTPAKGTTDAVLTPGGHVHDEWKVTMTPQGKKYYYNRRTRMSAWTLPADAVFVQTGDNVQRIYVPRKPNEGLMDNTPQREATDSSTKENKIANADTDSKSSKYSRERIVSTTSASTKPAKALSEAHGESSQSSTKSTDKKHRESSPLHTPPRSGRNKVEVCHSHASKTSSSPQSSGRRRSSPASSPSHSIYSPVGGLGLSTPSRVEHHPPVAHHNRSSNQTPSPGVAFAKRGAQSTVNDSDNSDSWYVAGPNARFNTTTKLDTLREESTDDIIPTYSTRGGRASRDGTSVLEVEDRLASRESRRLFLEDSSVVTAHSDSVREGDFSWYCPLCSVHICDRVKGDMESFEQHLDQCITDGDNLQSLQRFDKALQSVLTRICKNIKKDHEALPSSSVLTPIQHRRDSSPSDQSNYSVKIDSPHPETSLVMHESPLSYHPVGPAHAVEKKTYTQMYENRAILTADGSPSRSRGDDISETSSYLSATSSRSGRKQPRPRSAGAPVTPSGAFTSRGPSNTPLTARTRAGIPRQPPSISPALAKQVADMEQGNASVQSQFICPCCKSNAPKSREELLRHLRDCVSLGDGTDDEGSLSTARTVPIMQAAPSAGNVKGDVFHGLAEARTVCPFCGKPSTKSALSSHLLGCRKRKESQERRNAPAVVMSQSQKIPNTRANSTTPTHNSRSKEQQQKSTVDRLAKTATYSSRGRSGSGGDSGRSRSSPLVNRGRNERPVQVFRL